MASLIDVIVRAKAFRKLKRTAALKLAERTVLSNWHGSARAAAQEAEAGQRLLLSRRWRSLLLQKRTKSWLWLAGHN
jgi:hypothetical protein